VAKSEHCPRPELDSLLLQAYDSRV